MGGVFGDDDDVLGVKLRDVHSLIMSVDSVL